MLSKLVAEREQSGRTVGAAFQTHGPTAARLLGEVLRESVASGETAPDIAHFVTLLQRHLERSRQTMTEADQAHTRELGDDAVGRDARDAAKASVLSLVNSIRLALTSRFGQDFGGRLGASGPAPTTPSDVLSWGKKFHDALSSLALPAVDLDADDNDDVGTFSKEAAVRKLGQRLTALDESLGEVARETREAESTQAAKDKAVAAYDRTFSVTAGLLEVLLRFAGETSLANRVRPSTRRPGTTAQADGGTPTDPADPADPANPGTPATPGSPDVATT